MTYFSLGLDAIRRRMGLAGLIYGANLIMALLVTVPLYVVFSRAVSESGYSEELAGSFDLSLWADIMQQSPELVTTLFLQLFWMVPLYMAWNVLSLAGLAYALSTGGQRSFWQGVGRYGARALLLGLLYAGLMLAGIFMVGIVILIASVVFSGEAGSIWTSMVLLPLLSLLVFAVLDMMHDFARLELVLGERKVFDAWLRGLKWPFASADANSAYILWMMVAALTLLAISALDLRVGGVFLAFVVQQVMLFSRAAVTVGWIGSEVAVYEAQQRDNEPLIAEA